MPEQLLAEPEVRAFLADGADAAAATDATSSRTVFEPTSMTPTRIPVILASTPVRPASFTGTASGRRRRAGCEPVARRCRLS